MPAICREFIDGSAPHDGKNVADKSSVFVPTGANVRIGGRGAVTVGALTVCGDIALIPASTTVRVNGKFVHRIGDPLLDHESHPTIAVTGAPPGTVRNTL
jgi:uncharacterized Zn-binding protein involved in type VI secretion